MRPTPSSVLYLSCALIVALSFSFASGQEPAIQPRITRTIDETSLSVLHHNTHPLARAQFDQGVAPPSLPMQRMLLVLKHSDEQESALRQWLDQQHDKSSPNYHKWLTPEEFGKRFGPAEQDLQTVTAWLQSHGFQVAQVSKGRNVIEFSGTAAMVQEAFHTAIHKYVINSESHWANASDPSIPAALSPVVAGVWSLHNFLKKPTVHLQPSRFEALATLGSKPKFTGGSGLHALGPADYYKIYNISNISPPIGAVGSIGIVGRSNINPQDVTFFH
jgi:subtilase family serine protease